MKLFIIGLSLFCAIIIANPCLADCDPGDPGCNANVETEGHLWNEFSRTHGDDFNGGNQSGAGFMDMFSQGQNDAQVTGEITGKAEGAYDPDEMSSWSKAGMNFNGNAEHDQPGFASIEAGGEVVQNAFVEKDNSEMSYGFAGEGSRASFEGATESDGPVDFNAKLSACGKADIGFEHDTNYRRADASAQNQANAWHNGETGSMETTAMNQIGGGVQLNGSTAQFSGSAEIACPTGNAWTNGSGYAETSQEFGPNSYANSVRVHAREQAGSNLNP